MNTQTKGVRTLNPTYEELLPKWERCSDVTDGQDALHDAREKYLPRLTDESDAAYKARLKRSNFFNASYRTIAGLVGMAFRKPPVIEVPAGIEGYLDDIDMAGYSLDDLAKDMVEDSLEYGVFGLMVDYPAMPENVTALSKASAEQLGLRPLIQYYDCESIINWRYARINNREQLILVVLKEEASIAEDQFSHKCEPRYRVLDLDDAGNYRQRVFRINDKNEDEQVGGDIYPLMNGNPIAAIPFRIVGAMDEPPLIDLIDANLAHYQINSDYRNGLHFTALPTPVIFGYTPEKAGEKLYIGSTSAWVFPDPQANAKFLEFTGQGLSELREALGELKQEMAVLGARMIADESRHVETLGATQIKRTGENSILANIVIDVSKAIEWALGVFTEWAGQTGECKYEISREFNPAGLDSQQLTAVLGWLQTGNMPLEVAVGLLNRADLTDLGIEEYQAKLDMQGPPRPAPNTLPPPTAKAA